MNQSLIKFTKFADLYLVCIFILKNLVHISRDQ